MFVLAAGFALYWGSPVLATTYYVNTGGSIQTAINGASYGDTVEVAAGTYIERITLKNGVALIGASQSTTIIDGNNLGTVITCGSCDPNTVLDGFTITNGSASSGGGMYNNGDPTVTNCTFIGNNAFNFGGGMYNFYCSPTVSNCVFTGNSAVRDGGGMDNESISGFTSSTVINCIFSGNSADDFGGGMSNYCCSPTLINCTFNRNSATDSGGAVYFFGEYSDSILTNCIMWGNTAPQGPELSLEGVSHRPSQLTISHTDMEGGFTSVYVGAGYTLNWDDSNNLDVDPCFADPGFWHANDTPIDTNDDFWVDGDYHLKSQAGRWKRSMYIGLDTVGDGFINLAEFAGFANFWQEQGSLIPADLDNSGVVDLKDLKLLLDGYLSNYSIGEWVVDDVTSPCIDAGNPNSDWRGEFWPHGKRINMGAYGGTSQASMSLSSQGNIANLDGDVADFVGPVDLGMFAEKWCEQKVLMREDLNRDGVVNFLDYAIFANKWVMQGP